MQFHSDLPSPDLYCLLLFTVPLSFPPITRRMCKSISTIPRSTVHRFTVHFSFPQNARWIGVWHNQWTLFRLRAGSWRPCNSHAVKYPKPATWQYPELVLAEIVLSLHFIFLNSPNFRISMLLTFLSSAVSDLRIGINLSCHDKFVSELKCWNF